MRLIGTLPDRKLAQEFSFFLTAQEVENQIDYDHDVYQVWVIDEDDVDEAMVWFEEFQTDHNNPKFHGHQREAQKLEEEKNEALRKVQQADQKIAPEHYKGKSRMGFLTLVLVLLSILFFLWGGLEQAKDKEGATHQRYEATPVYKALMYDDPKGMNIFFELVTQFTPEELAQPEKLPLKGRLLMRQLDENPFYRGAYDEFFLRQETKDRPVPPLFEKISEGEVWRLFTPALLHADIFHIIFNVIAILFLGNQVESRLGFWRYLLLVILAGIISNTGQYLMTGANFLGLSGIAYAFFGFMWIRQRKAPWEGYLLNRPIQIFVFVLLFIMLALQIVSFFLQLAGETPIAPNIANTAHFVGLAVGIALALVDPLARQKLPKPI